MHTPSTLMHYNVGLDVSLSSCFFMPAVMRFILNEHIFLVFPRSIVCLYFVVLLGVAVMCYTQHLHPPVEIDPLPTMPRVKMPHMQPEEMTTFISQAETAMSERFDNFEPAIYNKGKQCLVLHYLKKRYQQRKIQNNQDRKYVTKIDRNKL